MFLPTTRKEMLKRGWQNLDVILVTGDAYIDSPFIGAAMIGRFLEDKGFRVGIIAQPDIHSPEDIGRLGQPALFWGVTAGSVDSMVANYTASFKRRKQDDYTPGGINSRRPDRASIVYTNLIRQTFKKTAPIVLGGIEASLRRVAHYDCWSNRIRRSILLDAKADVLVYGMGESAVKNLVECYAAGQSIRNIRGICYVADQMPDDCLELPSYEAVLGNHAAFRDMFQTFYHQNDARTARQMVQPYGNRYLVHNPPSLPLSQPDLDALHELAYERELHPFHQKDGAVRALDTIRFSIATHRGCFGECHFCAIAVHQGRSIQSRSAASILREAHLFTRHHAFKGVISDVGGPTANMFQMSCTRQTEKGVCPPRRCLVPRVCKHMVVDHRPQITLLQELRRIPGIRHVFVASGIRYDLILMDAKNGQAYLEELVAHHVSGQMKLAPEHSEPDILQLMGKPDITLLIEFKKRFDQLVRSSASPRYLTYYFIAGHPGCTDAHMTRLGQFIKTHLHIRPEQIQIFTPTPSTFSTLMYCTGENPFTQQPVFVEKNIQKKERQKRLMTSHAHSS
ncbi:MAG: YgiQ family radical SAM protein [Desulfatirhabdiaceae bacterium]